MKWVRDTPEPPVNGDISQNKKPPKVRRPPGEVVVEMPGVEPGSEASYSPSVYMRSPRIQGLCPFGGAHERGFQASAG